jgi:hypothetical protein
MTAEIICIRRLTRSDLGWFAVNRSVLASKQRAVNINANVAQLLVSPEAWDAGGVDVACRCIWPGAVHEQKRSLWKVGKNWRFGGPKLQGAIFRNVKQGDFFVLRSPAGNNGTAPMTLTFVAAATDPDTHALVNSRWGGQLSASMLVASSDSADFNMLAETLFPPPAPLAVAAAPPPPGVISSKRPIAPGLMTQFPPLPGDEDEEARRPLTLHERIRSPHILSQMLKVSGDLSADAHLEFMQVLELLAEQLRSALGAAGLIRSVEKNHRLQWESVRGKRIAFVDGGMANLSMLGATPVAARVGGYIVRPGVTGDEREQFIMVKHLIDELYTPVAGSGVYSGMFPDPSALRDAARISVEAAGAVQIVTQQRDVHYLFLHGALVNPVSRYTDIMDGGQVVAAFPNFSTKAQEVLLPDGERDRQGRDANFVRVYLRQLELLRDSNAVVCGVVERESQATSVYRRLIALAIGHPDVPPLLPKAPAEWAEWFTHVAEQFRISDALLFRCVLEPGEYLMPVDIDRNELQRAPAAWQVDIQRYPKPWVSYLLPTEWGQPIRIEIFEHNLPQFAQLAQLVMHCAWLLPRYAFPVGLDIADKYAKVPNWMTRPVNTNTAVQALRRALDTGDAATFDAMRRMLCGSTRDWLFRPKLF